MLLVNPDLAVPGFEYGTFADIASRREWEGEPAGLDERCLNGRDKNAETGLTVGKCPPLGDTEVVLRKQLATEFLLALLHLSAWLPNGHGLQRPGHRTPTGSSDLPSMPETEWTALFPGPLQGLVRPRGFIK